MPKEKNSSQIVLMYYSGIIGQPLIKIVSFPFPHQTKFNIEMDNIRSLLFVFFFAFASIFYVFLVPFSYAHIYIAFISQKEIISIT